MDEPDWKDVLQLPLVMLVCFPKADGPGEVYVDPGEVTAVEDNLGEAVIYTRDAELRVLGSARDAVQKLRDATDEAEKRGDPGRIGTEEVTRRG